MGPPHGPRHYGPRFVSMASKVLNAEYAEDSQRTQGKALESVEAREIPR